MDPSRRCVLAAACLGKRPRIALAADETVEVDISGLAPEELRLAQWKGQPVWILKRSPEMLETLASPALTSRLADPASTLDDPVRTPAYARNLHRSIRPEVFIGIAICPHAGCIPVARLKPGPNPERHDNWPGGFACPCHFATFDLAGRVFKDKPTDKNIEVPRHMYLTETTIVIGRDPGGQA